MIDQKLSLHVYYHNKFVGWLRNTNGRSVNTSRLYLTSVAPIGEDEDPDADVPVTELSVTVRRRECDVTLPPHGIVIPNYAVKDHARMLWVWHDVFLQELEDYEQIFDHPYFEPYDEGPDDETGTTSVSFINGTAVLRPKSTSVNVTVNNPGGEKSLTQDKLAEMIQALMDKAPKRPAPLQLHKGKYGYISQQKLPEPEDRSKIYTSSRYHTGGLVGLTSPLVKPKGLV